MASSALRRALLLVSLATAGTVACSSSTSSNESSAAAVSGTGNTFDKNNVLDDESLVAVDAMSEKDVQAFLEKTPYGTRSGLADYTLGSQAASTLIHDAAVANGINPLAMLVRLQMEEGLIHDTTAADEKVQVAFGCGCESA